MTEWIREIDAGTGRRKCSPRPGPSSIFIRRIAPCEALAGEYEPLSELYGREIPFFKVFRQKNRDLAGSLGVTSSPTVLFYKNGEPGARFSAIKRKDLVSQLDALLPTDTATAIHDQGAPERHRDRCAHPRRRAGRSHRGDLCSPGEGENARGRSRHAGRAGRLHPSSLQLPGIH